MTVNSVQSLSHVWLFATPWTAACQTSLYIANSRSLLKLMSVELMMPSHHLTLCRPLLLPPSIFLSIRVFSNESVLCIKWPKYWSFSFSIGPSNEHSGLSFRTNWFDLLAVQGIVKSLLQHHSSKTSVLQHSAFFIVQLSHPYTTTGKTIALTRRTFVGFSNGSDGKDPACQRRRCRFNSWRRSPWEGNGNPLHYFCLGSPMDRGAWRATVHGVTKSQTWLNDWARVHTGLPRWLSGTESACQCRKMQETRVWYLGWEDPLEKEMATHSSILAWRIPWTEEPGELQSTGSQRVGHDWVTSL